MVQPQLHQSLDPFFTERAIFVLHRTSHPGNIGASLRSLAVLDFPRMRCSAPRDPAWQAHPDAIARASGAMPRLKEISAFQSLQAAIADCHWVIAVSADVRDFGPDLVEVSTACAWATARMLDNKQARVAFVFGSERDGLAREEAARGHLLASIPGQPAYHSLNLSQAVMITAWELRKQLLSLRTAKDSQAPRFAAPPMGQPASADAFEGLMQHLQEGATALGFLDPKHPKMLMERLRRLLMRSELRAEEIDLLRGLCTAMIRPRDRSGRGLKPCLPEPYPTKSKPDAENV